DASLEILNHLNLAGGNHAAVPDRDLVYLRTAGPDAGCQNESNCTPENPVRPRMRALHGGGAGLTHEITVVRTRSQHFSQSSQQGANYRPTQRIRQGRLLR